MVIWIVRHGKAEPQELGMEDWVRRLVPRGERQAMHLGTLAAAHQHRPVAMLSSPVTRAAQTARLIAGILDLPVAWSAELETERPASHALALIDDHRDAASLMLVGHNNQVTELAHLLTRRHGQGAAVDELRTGEAIIIEIDDRGTVGTGLVRQRVRLDGE